MEITVKKLEEAGYNSALVGLSLNKNKQPQDMDDVAFTLSDKDYGHNKFLEHMYVWLLVRAPRYWWSEADTYRMSTKQSQSTIHTVMKNLLKFEDFEDGDIYHEDLVSLNNLINEKEFLILKKKLPEGFMQTREWCLSYKTLSNIFTQRATHKLPHWHEFIRQVLDQVQYPEFLNKKLKDSKWKQIYPKSLEN